jgi:hypothetical protein
MMMMCCRETSVYDWLHLHHEDFTGNTENFTGQRNAPWYIEDVKSQEADAAKWGYAKVSQLKLAWRKNS